LYNLHSGELGTTPSSVEAELNKVFGYVKRWNCVLLLDEADVFVRERGFDLTQNAVVAVFLRVLEYSAALMFMTTNMAGSIDDAIISRCAAIIKYSPPSREDRAAIWRVMAENNATLIDDDFLAALVDTFPTASPRDIKHLLRLALRVAKGQNLPLSLPLFITVGAFRAVTIVEIDPNMAKEVTATGIRKRERLVPQIPT
jgi:SpoVK/Ycf46/Vps4 family AAA+-type ATPase